MTAGTPSPQLPIDLVEHLNRGDCVLFLGDDLDDGPPRLRRLAAQLVNRAEAFCELCADPGACQRPDRCVVRLTTAAQDYESRFGRHLLISLVKAWLEEEAATPSRETIYAVAAKLPVRIIITTLYDNGLIRALQRAGRRYLEVVNDTDVPFDDPERTQIIRLHGTLIQPQSLVLTQDNAADLFCRLPNVTRILAAHFASKTLLFVGYGLKDDHFVNLHRQVMGTLDGMERMAYAVQWPANPRVEERWRGKIDVCTARPLVFLQQLVDRAEVKVAVKRTVELPAEPYKFLDYFTAQDAAIFCGRDLEADQLLSLILARRVSVLYGRSGTGKTSLLLARVCPALEEQGYRVAYARLLGDPGRAVKAAVRTVEPERLSRADRERPLGAVLADATSGGRLVVVLDQFEEFFIRQSEAVRRAFAQELADCLSVPDLDLHIVFSLRDDYLGALDELNDAFRGDLLAHRYRIENLTTDKARQAIQEPARAFKLPIEDTLLERLLIDLDDHGLEPASLQIVLFRLYQDAIDHDLWDTAAREGKGLTLARYIAQGETSGILQDYLDDVLEELADETARRQARTLLKSMVTAERTKAAVTGQELATADLVAHLGATEVEVQRLLGHLLAKRIIRKFGDEERYELAHDVLVAKVWTWVSEEELRLLDIRDMLRRELSNYRKFGDLLSQERLARVTEHGDALALDTELTELLLRSALEAGHEVTYWGQRAQKAGVDVDAIALEKLQSGRFRTRAGAVAALGQLGDRYSAQIIGALADDYPQVRLAAIHALERLQPDGAWRQYLRYECYVPAGSFIMGDDKSKEDNEKPAHAVYLDAYYIGKYPVTNADYQRYMADRGRTFSFAAGKEDHPAVYISWFDAAEYAEWAGVRLPTEAEWEKAASWEADDKMTREQVPALSPLKGDKVKGRKRTYPWGDRFVEGRCNSKEAGVNDTTPVDAYSPAGDSPYGVADMAGNVWEWCADWYAENYYRTSPRTNPTGPADGYSRVLRGGAYWEDKGRVGCCVRDDSHPLNRSGSDGVRVCASPPPLPSDPSGPLGSEK